MGSLGRAALALPLLLAPAFLLAASAPVPAPETLGAALKRAQSEAAAADAQARRLDQQAAAAQDEVSRLQAEQAAAAEAIAGAEARISAAEARVRIAAAQLADRRRRLQQEQAPAASLLAGLALMAQRPPLVALADSGSTEEFVRVRLLLDSTLPAIRARSVALSSDVARGQALQQAALAARQQLIRSRDELLSSKRRFAALEQQAAELAARSGTQALGAGDVALASGEEAEQLAREAASAASGARLAREMASLGPAPRRPFKPEGGPSKPPFQYQLPAAARVTEGLGALSDSGVRSRGLTLATPRGTPLLVPASGIVRFAGPFRRYDGIVIIDHGNGWMSLILNVATTLRRGQKVAIGDPLGRALGPAGVELTRNGRHLSPALIAGSSETLSNGRKDG
ncbi:MAG TPA: peptidoglycan DD-metalloendopeptidase family protein [Sphingomicrobium sp.]|nr:peptidoglycan DD-metalloendopeptidase family protein [Sphingomicrobium sp.]